MTRPQDGEPRQQHQGPSPPWSRCFPGKTRASSRYTNFMIYALTYNIADKILGLPALDWSTKIKTEIGSSSRGMRMMAE